MLKVGSNVLAGVHVVHGITTAQKLGTTSVAGSTTEGIEVLFAAATTVISFSGSSRHDASFATSVSGMFSSATPKTFLKHSPQIVLCDTPMIGKDFFSTSPARL